MLLLLAGFATLILSSQGCKKDLAEEASDSDANGYLCLKCSAKLYTPRTVFIGPQCPKCQQQGLISLVAYRCVKDQQVIMRPARDDRQGVPVCEVCKANLSKSMFLPKEKDLQAWGATKAPP